MLLHCASLIAKLACPFSSLHNSNSSVRIVYYHTTYCQPRLTPLPLNIPSASEASNAASSHSNVVLIDRVNPTIVQASLRRIVSELSIIMKLTDLPTLVDLPMWSRTI